MKSYYLITLLIISLYGCKGKQLVLKEKESVEKTQDSNIKVAVSNEDSVSVDVVDVDSTLINDSIHRQTVIVRYSKPDSVGCQYVTEHVIEDEFRVSVVRKSNNKLLHFSSSESNDIEIVDETLINENVSFNNKLIEKKKPPSWIFVFCMLMLIGLFAILYLKLYKK